MISADIVAAVSVPCFLAIGGWVFYIDRAVVRCEEKQKSGDQRFEEIKAQLTQMNAKLDLLFVPRAK